ncbi:MAG TPA: hypothetical protein VMC08_09935 [Bacteroidales bacterium]|nr:hypothetical protein [Bacteroidales bacterium]
MKPILLSFTRNLAILALVLGVVITVLYFLLPHSYFTPALPWLFIFFLTVTFAGFWVLIYATRGKFIRFLNLYLLTTIVKLVFFIGILVAYLFVYRKDAVPFGLWFFILYLVFTFFEAVALISYSKKLQT